jgi:hypothetical protein
MKLPTDYAILDAIYTRYYARFAAFSVEVPDRSAKIYVPIDNQLIADRLGVDVDLVFGRLYYNLEKKFGYKQADGTSVHFFALQIGQDRHCINFPLLGAVLADLKDVRGRNRWAVGLALTSLLVSVLSLAVSALIGLT